MAWDDELKDPSIRRANVITAKGEVKSPTKPNTGPSSATVDSAPSREEVAQMHRRQRIRSGQAPTSPAAKAVKSVMGHWSEVGKSKEKRQEEMAKLNQPVQE